MENICYKKNPIKESLVKIDFFNPINQFDIEIPNDIVNKIKVNFPIPEPRELIARGFQISNNGIKQSENKHKEWNFYNRNKDRRIVITKDSVSVVHSQYENYEVFIKDFRLILDAIGTYDNSMQIKRFGLRYINNLEFANGDPFKWNQYLNKKLLCSFEIPKEKKYIARSFHNLELNYGDFFLRFQYGMHNPDYPAVIKKKIFILDFDAYYSGILERNELEQYFQKFHDAIQDMFEKSITSKYRDFLNNER